MIEQSEVEDRIFEFLVFLRIELKEFIENSPPIEKEDLVHILERLCERWKKEFGEVEGSSFRKGAFAHNSQLASIVSALLAHTQKTISAVMDTVVAGGKLPEEKK